MSSSEISVDCENSSWPAAAGAGRWSKLAAELDALAGRL
jgi:hypothetical protein